MATQAIAVFDIGKTNKKLTLFDAAYQVLHEEEQQLEEVTDDDGFACENLEAVSQWVQQAVDRLKAQDDYEVKAINVSAYGASLVHLDAQRRPVTPLYNYLKPFPEALATQFYKQYGDREAFALQTASPPMGMLNAGLQLYWLKHSKPEVFSQISHSLHLPQYIACLVHQKMHSDITSVGCHTGLWNFETNSSHRWVDQEDLASLLPPIVSTTAYETIPYHTGKSVLCGVGIHDSSAALVPYLMGFADPFMLLSTGTWNITLNPFNQEPLTAEELHKDCLNYMNYLGKPVKAARIFLGKEHDHHEKRIAAHFSKGPAYHHTIVPDKEILQGLLKEQQAARKFYPKTMQNTGPVPGYTGPDTDLSLFGSYEEAYHQLVLDLVSMQVLSLKLAIGNTSPDKLFISGGFCNNQLFMQLLASYLPEVDLYITNLKRASALGAALVLHQHWNKHNSIDHLLTLEKIQPMPIPIPSFSL